MMPGRKTIGIGAFAVGAAVVLALTTTASADSDGESTPAEALNLAEEILEHQWKVRGDYHREVTGHTNDELLAAFLGAPLVECELREEAIEQFLSSNEADSRSFANIVKYSFPVLMEGDAEPVGAIVVWRNRDASGQKVALDGPEFLLYGYYLKGEGIVNDAFSLQYKSGSTVYVVWFRDIPIERRLVVEDGDAVFSGTTTHDLVPIEVDSRAIREWIGTYRRQIRELKERSLKVNQ